MDRRRISAQFTSIATILCVSSALSWMPLTAQSPASGGQPKPVTVTRPPGVIKQPPAITPPPFGPPKPVIAPGLPGPIDFNAPPTWRLHPDGLFETAHPYQNYTTLWKPLYLPEGATKLRLYAIGQFELEGNYDFLELWEWKNAAWGLLKRYTGTVGPTRAEEFPGRYFFLKLGTDASVTKEGFKVSAEYRN